MASPLPPGGETFLFQGLLGTWELASSHLSGSRLWAPTVSMSLRLSMSCLLSLISLDATHVLIWSLSRCRWGKSKTVTLP